jgi:hypothetical protein
VRRLATAVAVVALATLVVGGAHATFDYSDEVSYDISTWSKTTPDGTYYQVVVEQKVWAGVVGTPDEGLFQYLYIVTNNYSGSQGMHGPLAEFGFTESWMGGPILAHFEPSNWSFTDTGPSGTGIKMPYWTWNGTGDSVEVGESLTVAAVSKGPPDFWYWGQAKDGTTVTGQTTGPTPEPCTLGLLGLSGLAMIRLFKRKRE